MNEPKKRGRPTNAEIAARDAAKQLPNSVPAINGDTSGQLERVEDERATEAPPASDLRERAQAYAMRVWSGQSVNVGRAERIARCERALIDQGLPADGVSYPGDVV
jgi:hypothetical protein